MEPYGPRADVWSLGCCILELATGKCPHAGLNEVQAMFRMVQDAHPEIPPSLPDSLRDFLLQVRTAPPRYTHENTDTSTRCANLATPCLSAFAGQRACAPTRQSCCTIPSCRWGQGCPALSPHCSRRRRRSQRRPLPRTRRSSAAPPSRRP